MIVTKCDLCRKSVKAAPVIVEWGFSSRSHLCEKCGAPILAFLRKNKLIKEEKPPRISKGIK